VRLDREPSLVPNYYKAKCGTHRHSGEGGIESRRAARSQRENGSGLDNSHVLIYKHPEDSWRPLEGLADAARKNLVGINMYSFH
jgi:hypothetical protein